MSHFSGYHHLEVEEIVKESERAFFVRFHDGEQEWLLKEQVVHPSYYSVGDRGVTIHLKGDSDEREPAA